MCISGKARAFVDACKVTTEPLTLVRRMCAIEPCFSSTSARGVTCTWPSSTKRGSQSKSSRFLHDLTHMYSRRLEVEHAALADEVTSGHAALKASRLRTQVIAQARSSSRSARTMSSSRARRRSVQRAGMASAPQRATGDAASDCAGRVRVVAEVDGGDEGVLQRVVGSDVPEGGFEAGARLRVRR